ncbi:zingipain-2-like [Prosopis cineraria]|uniref:zingipain-2-like n=1 Tax=Prosopis cineraria TaxID=364024 RepID=UPI00240F527A|nr:zingipain-2-like [Prosopis cineraria]
MRATPILISLVLILSLFSVSSSANTSELFESWCKQHGKTYSSEQEKLYRFKVFEDNYAFVSEHNEMGNSSYTLSLNTFADLTNHEFKVSRLGLSPALLRFDHRTIQQPDDLILQSLPTEVDWRKKGAVTQVKDQASCGACWSFSATGAIEGINKIVTDSLVSLSEQELVDCDRTYNTGCQGGLMDYAYQFVIDNHGIDTEEDYPYQGRERSCIKDKLGRHVVTIDGYTDVPPNDEKQLLKAVATQPVSVGICGSDRAFQLYSKGIFTGPCSTSLDHAVLIVGYGSENGVDYWIVKNSWGTSWGMNGYIHMRRNTENSQGLCGINMLASYPTKTSPNPPPPSPPTPIKCNLFTYCAQGETCCCARRFLGICISWKCCGLSSAVCCKDNRHCCPHDYPVCDIRSGQCLKGNANMTRTKAREIEGPFHKPKGWNSQ